MDVTGSFCNSIPDGKMEAYEAQPPAGSQSIDERRLGKDQSIFRPTFEVSDHAILSGEEGSKHLSLFLRAGRPNTIGKVAMVARTRNRDLVTLGLIQMSTRESPDANLATALLRIGAAAKKGAQIVCLQELFRSRYFCQNEDHQNFKLAGNHSRPEYRSSGKARQGQQNRHRGVPFEKRSAGIYHNTAVIIDADGTIAGKYRKNAYPG